MNWVKAGLIAVGALIAFILIESVFHLLEWAFIALVIGLVIAVAIKAHHQYRLAMERRAQVKEEKAARKAQVREHRTAEVEPAPSWTPQRTAAPSQPAHGVDEELARLKREMGA